MTDSSASLSDTYRRYKDGTNRVITWLAIAAQKSSYNSLKTPPRSKKKSGAAKHKASSRAAKNPKKIIALLSDMVPFATYVASQGIEVPIGIIEILQRVICVRKECALWYRSRASSDQGANEGHQHFINILQAIYDLVEPRKAPRTFSKQESASKKHTKVAGLANIFEHLELEKLGDSELVSQPVQTTNKVELPTVVVPDLRHVDETAGEERLFALFCFFQTMFTVRSFLIEEWLVQAIDRSHRNLGSLSLTTNAAMNMIRRTQGDMVDTFPEFSDHAKVLEFLQRNEIDVKSEDASQIARSTTGEIRVAPKQPFYHDIWHLLNYACTAHSKANAHFCSIEIPDGISKSDLLALQLEQSKRSLCNEYLNLAHLNGEGYLCSNYQLEQGSSIMKSTKKVPTWVVFSFEMVFALQYLFTWCGGDISASHEHLRTLCGEVSTTLSQYTDFAKTYSEPEIDNLKGWHEVIKEPVRHWSGKARRIYNEDMLGRVRKIRINEAEDPGEAYLFKHDPVLSGLIAMDFKMIMHIMGLGLGSSGNVVTSCAHLYNAAIQYELLDKTWVDMETMISFQSEQQIFVGARPKQPPEIVSRCMLAMGVSPTVVASHVRESFNKPFLPMNAQRMGRKLEPTSPYVRLSFERRHKMLQATASLHDIAKLFESVVACQRRTFSTEECLLTPSNNSDRAPNHSDSFRTAKEVFGSEHKSRDLEPVQRLAVFLERMQADSAHLDYNYFNLFQSCFEMMRTARDMLIHGTDHTVDWPAAEWRGDRCLQFLTPRVLGDTLIPDGLFSLKEASDAILSQILERGNVQHQQQRKKDAVREEAVCRDSCNRQDAACEEAVHKDFCNRLRQAGSSCF